MTSLETVVFHARVSTKGGTWKNLIIKHASSTSVHPRTIAELYNSVLDLQLESGMAIQEHHVVSRLDNDPRSVYLAFVENKLAALINVARRDLASEDAIPHTHQALTDEDTFSLASPYAANRWFCPWVVVAVPFRRYRAEFGGILRSIGQLLVLAVGVDAVRDRNIEQLFAFSRPAELSSHLTDQLQSPIIYTPNREDKTAEILLRFSQEHLLADRTGLFREGAEGKKYVLTIEDYWNLKRGQRRRDPVFDFHASNGASIRLDKVFPYGQIFDGNSLGYRTLFEYPLDALRELFRAQGLMVAEA